MSEDPQEERRRELKRTLRKTRKRIEDLRGEVTFSEVIEHAEACRAGLPDVRAELVRLRSRGYAFRGDLEERLGGWMRGWSPPSSSFGSAPIRPHHACRGRPAS